MIWAMVCSQSCLGWLYRTSPSLPAKNIISLILVLSIWWCPYVESSLVLLEWYEYDNLLNHTHIIAYFSDSNFHYCRQLTLEWTSSYMVFFHLVIFLLFLTQLHCNQKTWFVWYWFWETCWDCLYNQVYDQFL